MGCNAGQGFIESLKIWPEFLERGNIGLLVDEGAFHDERRPLRTDLRKRPTELTGQLLRPGYIVAIDRSIGEKDRFVRN